MKYDINDDRGDVVLQSEPRQLGYWTEPRSLTSSYTVRSDEGLAGAVAGGLAPVILLCESMGGFPEPDTLGTTAMAGHPSWVLAPTSLPRAFQRSTATRSPAAVGQHPCIPTAHTQ